MENREPTQIVRKLYNHYIELNKNYIVGSENQEYWKGMEDVKLQLANITKVVGAVEVMSKKAILQLCTLQGKLQFLPHHVFFIYISKSIEK